jgi:hypothetical protein
MHLGLKVTKKDLFCIVLLSVIFFSITVTNLGDTEVPTSTAQLIEGQSFYVDLGSFSNLQEIMILVKSDGLNVTIFAGDLGNWNLEPIDLNTYWPQSIPTHEYAYIGEYYKWHEIFTGQSTRYLKFDFGTYDYSTVIAEIAVIDEEGHQIPIQSIHNLGTPNPDLPKLIDEQNLVTYPVTYMSQTTFDEKVYVQSAEQYLHLQLPKDPVEPAHPPLGKLIQESSIAFFGYSPFGWRAMGVIFATAMIALIYVLGKELFGTWIGGFAAAFLLTFDFLHFTLARIGVIDTYLVFFSLASQLFYFIYLKNVLRKGWKTSTAPLAASIILFGLGFSTKWLIIFGFLGEMAILAFLRLYDIRKLKTDLFAKIHTFTAHPFRYVLISLLVAVGIYFLTFLPDIIGGRPDVLGLHSRMVTVHSSYNAAFMGAPWYSWPLLFDPFNSNAPVLMWLSNKPLTSTLSSGLVLMGNPIIWWIGSVALFSLAVIYLQKIVFRKFQFKENLLPLALVVVFIFQWLSYALVPRTTFIYHFYISVPLLCLASAFFISKYWSSRWVKLLTVGYFTVVIAFFILFYPIISGVPASPSTINSLQWLSSWCPPIGLV